ncbi:DUF998 domain-containing protein [Streptococcus mutans]|uniref:DUF998 domain-containing protein n=1 Tax=Streptococcus mutans TaxID=1309 RepID=UPI0002B5A461|nr:DUF998 domain-containing protein [Streptococcus mutans]EMC02687.1 hypothetical protein SMU68_06428 [Streptococcus mutans NFSM1]NLQ89306.1 DUF998 domain-containing protein [Streptococcus mutans]
MLLTIFSILAILCLVLYFYCMVILHLKNKGVYHPMTHAVSDYGIGQNKSYFQLAGLANTFRNLFLILSLIFWKYSFSFKKEAILLLILAIIGYAGVALFPTDIEGSKRTVKGIIHLLFAILQFTALAIFIFNVTEVLKPLNATLFLIASYIKIVVEVGLYGLVIALFLPFVKKYFGLFERLFLYSSNLYILLLCVMMIRY